jgi:hypothetical protein
MKTQIYKFISIIFTVIVFFQILVWVNTFIGNSNTFIENKTIFLNYYPESLRNPYLLTFIQIIMLSISLYIIRVVIKEKSVSNKIYKIVKVIDIIMIVWLIFSIL